MAKSIADKIIFLSFEISNLSMKKSPLFKIQLPQIKKEDIAKSFK